jgi:hypothetical protein
MKIPDHFFRYFLIAAGFLLLGILFVIVQTAVVYHHVPPLNATELRLRADYHDTVIMPAMANLYPKILFLNAGVALFILIVPLSWVWVWWFRRDHPDPIVALMQATVCLLMWALGHNSFSKVYVTYRLLSWQMIGTMYLPHGWLEMLAFILAGTCAFLTIDALKGFLIKNAGRTDLHPGDICLFILGRVWKAGILIFILMAIAAAVECRVTPELVRSAYEVALQRV